MVRKEVYTKRGQTEQTSLELTWKLSVSKLFRQAAVLFSNLEATKMVARMGPIWYLREVRKAHIWAYL
jgi:hypothetical protein